MVVDKHLSDGDVLQFAIVLLINGNCCGKRRFYVRQELSMTTVLVVE